MTPLLGIKKLKVLSKHTKLSEAVAAAGIDLSYNEPLARRDLKIADNHKAMGVCYVVALESYGEKKQVFFEYNCDLKLLNRYSPFHSCLDDNPFKIATIETEGDECYLVQYPERFSKRDRLALVREQRKPDSRYYYTSDSFQ
jgi:hypothetical protein